MYKSLLLPPANILHIATKHTHIRSYIYMYMHIITQIAFQFNAFTFPLFFVHIKYILSVYIIIYTKVQKLITLFDYISEEILCEYLSLIDRLCN